MEALFRDLAAGLATFYKESIALGLDPQFVEELVRLAMREMLEAVKMIIQMSVEARK